MKNQYVKPMATIEEFVVNEFVATCITWEVGCDVMGTKNSAQDPKADEYTTAQQAYTNHRKTNCGKASNQQIRVRPSGAFTVYEVNTQQGVDLQCTLTDSSWNPISSVNYNEIKQGERIYWTTSYTYSNRNIGLITWHHTGLVGKQIGTEETNRS